ncbi:hypothetical protein Msil_2974 [Methylocella silvestris BL2]|uniref:Transcriptional regulator n=1 Tax=Methylocella silvestris (strain DSM 15510 / CIP 108128 / LMG 27833 / NCIMB 13906 / BL2) TaxID=395965 RepID=B8EIR8_METSB|nr:hypothetical protein [Methylocella silvestris]ACK51885.1 hypothetical protein Msil_2974 [Methylocella silvestris BL2]
MLTIGYQLAAARALIGMDRTTLAKLAKVGEETITTMESAKDSAIAGHLEALAAVQRALEAAGVAFLGDGYPGVRLKNGSQNGGSIDVEDLTSENDE